MNDAKIDYLSEIGRADAMLKQGQPSQAAFILETILPYIENCKDEFKAGVYYKQGKAYAQADAPKDAITCLEKAITLDETLVEAYLHLCVCCTRAIELEKAVEYGEKGLKHDPKSTELLKAVLEVKRVLWQVEDSLELMENSPAFNRKDPFLLLNYGLLLHEAGDKNGAHDALARVLKKKPDYAKAHRLFSLVHRYEKGERYFAQLSALVNNKSLQADEAADAHFALAKAHEDLKDFEKAFEHYEQANYHLRSLYALSMSQHQNIIQQMKETFTADYIKEFRSKYPMEEGQVTPIFIVGMPRSGTSLLEQILSSHTDVYGAGELNELEVFLYKNASYNRDDFKGVWDKLAQEGFQNIASQYCDRLSRDIDGERYVTDKLPRNFVNCGVIMCLFPNAKIIHIRRNPQANCLSLFKTYFTGMASYSTDQEDLAEYYTLYEDIMKHWHSVAPTGAIYDVHYEDLVQNPEGNIKALVEHCGMEWQNACLEFHKTKRSVVAVNALQVKKPVYTDALAYWKNFEPYMAPEILNLGKKK